MVPIKSLIQEHLHILKEAKQRASKADYLRTTYRVSILTQQYKHDQYFMKEDSGDFIAAAIVDIHGNVRISQVAKVPAGDLKNHRLGITRDTKDYMQFYIMAGRGIQHPDTYKEIPDNIAQTRQGIQSYTKTVHLDNPIQIDDKVISTMDVQLPQAGSPASDAQIKTYLLYGPHIIDFVEKNLDNPIGYQDGKAPEIRNQMNIKKKIEIIRKDAEDYVNKNNLPRVRLIQAFETFKAQHIDTLSTDEQLTMDTTAMTKAFIQAYTKDLQGSKTKAPTSLSQDDADDVMKRQAQLQAKVAAMRAKRG